MRFKTIVAVILSFSLAGVAKADGKLTKEHFNLIHQCADELEDISKQLNRIAGELRTIPSSAQEQLVQAEAPIVPMKIEPVKPAVKDPPCIIYLSALWCGPCARVKAEVFPVLKKAGWVIKEYGEEGGANIWIVDIDKFPEYAAKFSESGRDNSIPHWVFVNGEQKRHVYGKLTVEQVKKEWK